MQHRPPRKIPMGNRIKDHLYPLLGFNQSVIAVFVLRHELGVALSDLDESVEGGVGNFTVGAEDEADVGSRDGDGDGMLVCEGGAVIALLRCIRCAGEKGQREKRTSISCPEAQGGGRLLQHPLRKVQSYQRPVLQNIKGAKMLAKRKVDIQPSDGVGHHTPR